MALVQLMATWFNYAINYANQPHKLGYNHTIIL